MPEVADIPLELRDGQPPPSRAAQALPIAASVRALPAGYVQLGVAKEIAPTLHAFGLDPDPIVHANTGPATIAPMQPKISTRPAPPRSE